MASCFSNDLYASLAIIGKGHFPGTGAAEPEMLHTIGWFGFGWGCAHQLNSRRLLRLNHKNLAFAQINQRSGTGRVSAFCEHIHSFAGIPGPQKTNWGLFDFGVDAGCQHRVRREVFSFAQSCICF
jgi:hypothetical protein